MLVFGLNQVTLSEMPFGGFLEVAARLRCVGVELRNDLGRPLFDGMDAHTAGARIRDQGLRLLGLSQVYPFNRWNESVADETARLIDAAVAAGAETISLIPCNDGTGTKSRQADLRHALEKSLPLLQSARLTALIEPLGFERASLRKKSEVVHAIEEMSAETHVKIVHDTFHHTLSGGGPLFPEQTGIVHISGVSEDLPASQMEDAHRMLINAQDRLNNLRQIRAMLDAGYTGAFSFECFAPQVRHHSAPEHALRHSMDFIASQLQQEAA